MHQIFMSYDKWGSLVPLLGGVYALLLAYKVLPIKAGDHKYSDEWYKKYGALVKILGLMMIVGGIVSLLFA